MSLVKINHDECGWSGIYDSAARADYALRRHSCAKSRAKSESRLRRLEREARVDRQPKPCTHKRARHQHGTRAAYVLDVCRCFPCAAANSLAENDRERQKAYGRYDVFTDAEPIRAHLAELAAYGIGLKTVSKISGVSNGSLTKIVYGRYASVDGPQRGRYGAGEIVAPPARRVKRTTAERILAVQAVPANLPPGGLDLERSARARLQLRALVALGWSMTKVGARIGMTSGNFGRVIHSDDPMTRSTVDKVVVLYGELSMTLPPATAHREKISVSRARRLAKTRGWLPPLDLEVLWDDAASDDGPAYDEAAVTRRLDGDRTAVLTRADRVEVVRRAFDRGWSYNDIERRAGVSKPERYVDRANTEQVAS